MFVLAGCRSASGQKPTPEQISDALLTITDMEGEWSETQRQVFDERSPENPSIDPSIWCPEAAEVSGGLVDLAGQAGADVEMQFEGKEKTFRLMRLQAWSNDDVEEYFRDAREAVQICDGVTATDESGVVSTTEVVSGRDIGDESISWSQKLTPPAETQGEKMESVGRTTIARFGDIIMVLQIGDAGPAGEATSMADEEWWSIVEMAGKKLDELDQQVHD